MVMSLVVISVVVAVGCDFLLVVTVVVVLVVSLVLNPVVVAGGCDFLLFVTLVVILVVIEFSPVRYGPF